MRVTEKTCIERNGIMSTRSKREYLEAIYLRYRGAAQKKKAIILDEFCPGFLEADIPLLAGHLYGRHVCIYHRLR